jgi:cytochrome c553
MKKIMIFSILILTSLHAIAGDVAAGKAKAASCAACHGKNGISPNPEWPNLAGQKEKYLKNQLVAFRDGKRNSPMMTPLAKALSDTDIDNLSAYFASLKP